MKPFPSRTGTAVDEQASLWAARLDGSTLTAEDRNALDAWLAADPRHRALLSSYCQFSADLEQQLPLIAGIREEAGGARQAPETATPSPWLRWPRLAGVMLTAAAAAALLLWVGRPRLQYENLITPIAQRSAATLSDGTRIELNAQTSLRVDIGREARHVRLAAGEAFFEVSKDPARPFVIETPAGTVRVTGTRFNVRTESPDSLEVTVAEGSVQVRPGGVVAPVALAAGDQLSSAAGTVRIEALDATALDNRLAWRRGQAVFVGTPLREALARFARYHGRGIGATVAAGEVRIGGLYSLDDLDGFLASLEASESLQLKVTRDLSGTVQVGLRSER